MKLFEKIVVILLLVILVVCMAEANSLYDAELAFSSMGLLFVMFRIGMRVFDDK